MVGSPSPGEINCQVCEKSRKSDFPRTFSVVAIRKSRDGGCWLCSTVLDAVDILRPGWTSDHLTDGFVRYDPRRFHGDCDLRFEIHTQNEQIDSFHLYQHQGMTFCPLTSLALIWQKGLASSIRTSTDTEKMVEPHESVPRHPCLPSLDIVRRTSSEAAFYRVLSWVNDCLTNHDECRLPDGDFVPRRLVRVGPWNGDTEPFLFEPKEPCNYVALSYCWGVDVSEVLATTTARLETYTSGIQLSSLPKTIQDAIVFCRGIRVEYLWVDMLCIVQDDPEDWIREASQMHLVYSNSHLTVAAHKPTSCREGFLGEQEFGQETWQRPFRPSCSGQKSEGVPDRMYIRRGSPPLFKTASALELRGWTVQEGILPTRILHLTGAEMAWECNTRDMCECNHMIDRQWAGRLSQPFLKSLFQSGDGSRFGPQVPTGNSWMAVAVEFSYRKLTKQSDKLIALSGVAQTILASAPPETVYLAGIWQDQLPKLLLWRAENRRIDTHDSEHKRPAKYRAPSWSWASIDGPIEYDIYTLSGEETSHVDTIDCLCIPESSLNPTGTFTGGHITIRGLLMPVVLATRQIPRGWSRITDRWRGHATWIRTSDKQTSEISCDLPQIPAIKTASLGFECWRKPCNDGECEDCDVDIRNTPFFCLKIASYESCGILSLYFLVLKSAGGHPYERIGVGCVGREDFFATAKMATVKLV